MYLEKKLASHLFSFVFSGYRRIGKPSAMRVSDPILVLAVLVTAGISESSRILMYFPISTPSHKNVFRPLAHELAARGHHVTLITTLRDDFVPENVTEIFVEQRENLLEQAAKEAMNPSFSDGIR